MTKRPTVAILVGPGKQRSSTRDSIHISTWWGKAWEAVVQRLLGIHIPRTSNQRNPKQIRHLRGSWPDLYWHPSSAGKGPGSAWSTPADGPERKLGGGRRCKQGHRRLSIPGAPTDSGRQGQSRALPTSPWRSGVQFERSVRDPAGLDALGAVNHVARPRRVGMEAGAFGGPTGNLTTDNRWPWEEKRKSDLPAPGSCFGDGPTGETQAGRRVVGVVQSSRELPSST